jgi:putative transcriptional regulator
MMPKMTRKQLAQWEKSRNIGHEILEGIRDIKAGRTGRRYTGESFPIVRAREKSGLSQGQFAALLGVSVRTLQECEQGRREPSTAAKTLINIAELHPGVLRKIAA